MQTSDTSIEDLLASYQQAGDVPLPDCPLVTEAFRPVPPHRVGVAHLLLRPRFHLWDPTGTGKTPQTLVSYAYLRANPASSAMQLLVLVRKSALGQWRAQAQRFLHPSLTSEIIGYDPEDMRIEWRESKRADQYARWFAGQTNILIGTYNTLAKDWSKEGKHTSDGFRKSGGREKPRREWNFLPSALPQYTVVFDEEHNVRGHRGTVIYPAMELVSAAARCAWGLTATPLFHRLDDLYGVTELVRPGTLSTYADFASRYINRFLMPSKKGGKKFWKVTGPKKDQIPHLMARLRPFYLQRPIEVFDQYLPEVSTRPVMVDLGAKQRKLYEQVKAENYPVVQHVETKTAQTIAQTIVKQADQFEQAAAAAARAGVDPFASPPPPTPHPFTIQQKMTALLYAQLALDAPIVLGVVDSENAKMDELLRMLRDDARDDSVLIYTRFEQVATAIAAAIRGDKDAGDVTRITGKESGGARRQAQEDFQAGRIRRAIITSAGGEALDLQAARILVFYDLPWSWGEFLQVLGRARRTGSAHRSILLLLLGTSDTLEDKILSLLQAQEKLVASAFKLTDLTLKTASFSERNDSRSVSAGVLSADTFSSTDFITSLFDALYESPKS